MQVPVSLLLVQFWSCHEMPDEGPSLLTLRDMERARTGLPCFWLVTEGVTINTTKIIYLLFLKYLLTSTSFIDLSTGTNCSESSSKFMDLNEFIHICRVGNFHILECHETTFRSEPNQEPVMGF